mgnify:CR=1 FL=1
MRRNKGFTLIEIMIALAVFAVVAAALVKNAALSVKQTAAVRDKTIAYWIADNQLARIRSTPKSDEHWPLKTARFQERMADRDWEVVTDVKATENENVGRVTVSVYRHDNVDVAIAELSGFVGRY